VIEIPSDQDLDGWLEALPAALSAEPEFSTLLRADNP